MTEMTVWAAPDRAAVDQSGYCGADVSTCMRWAGDWAANCDSHLVNCLIPMMAGTNVVAPDSAVRHSPTTRVRMRLESTTCCKRPLRKPGVAVDRMLLAGRATKTRREKCVERDRDGKRACCGRRTSRSRRRTKGCSELRGWARDREGKTQNADCKLAAAVVVGEVRMLVRVRTGANIDTMRLEEDDWRCAEAQRLPMAGR